MVLVAVAELAVGAAVTIGGRSARLAAPSAGNVPAPKAQSIAL
jgi:hypothetical protein